MWVRCISSTTAESMPCGSISSFFHSACRFSGASFRVAFGSSDQANWRHEEVRQVAGDLQVVAALGLDLEELRDLAQPARIGDLVLAALALRHQLEGLHQHAAVVGVGGGAGRDLAQQVARDDGIRIRAANALRRLGGDAARPHVAQPAADARRCRTCTAAAGLVAVPDRGHLGGAGDVDHLVDGRVARDGLSSLTSVSPMNDSIRRAEACAGAHRGIGNLRHCDAAGVHGGHAAHQREHRQSGSPVASASLRHAGGSTPSGTRFTIRPRVRAPSAHLVGQLRDALRGAHAAHGAVGDDQQLVERQAACGARYAPARPRCRPRCAGSCGQTRSSRRAGRCWRSSSSPGLRAGPSRSGRSRSAPPAPPAPAGPGTPAWRCRLVRLLRALSRMPPTVAA